MRQVKPTIKHLYVGSAVLLLTGFLLWILIHAAAGANWNNWVNNVQIACQPGSNENSVRRLLGEPGSVREDSLEGVIPPPPDGVENTERVLLYTRYFFGKGVWFVHVYLDKDGDVTAYHISRS